MSLAGRPAIAFATVPENALNGEVFLPQRHRDTEKEQIAANDISNPQAPPLNLCVSVVKKNSPSDGWSALRDALTATERDALALVLRGELCIKAFADQHHVMLEVLADGINEKATDYVGDNILILDETVTIYDDYRELVAEIVG